MDGDVFYVKDEGNIIILKGTKGDEFN
jgi:hypothetical protein